MSEGTIKSTFQYFIITGLAVVVLTLLQPLHDSGLRWSEWSATFGVGIGVALCGLAIAVKFHRGHFE